MLALFVDSTTQQLGGQGKRTVIDMPLPQDERGGIETKKQKQPRDSREHGSNNDEAVSDRLGVVKGGDHAGWGRARSGKAGTVHLAAVAATARDE